MTLSISRGRLLAGAALGLGLAVLVPSQAEAACAVSPAASPVTGTVTCGTTTTANTTYPTNSATGTDREYQYDTTASNVTGTVSTGAVVDGYGLAFTGVGSGVNDLFIVNNGAIQVNAGNTATAGGTAALSVSAIGATDVFYSGQGSVTNLGTGGDGIDFNMNGSGFLTANVFGNVSTTGFAGIQVNGDAATSGNLVLTTEAGDTILADFVGIWSHAFGAGNTANLTVVNNATLGPITGTLDEGITVATSGLGNVAVTNNGAIGTAANRVGIGIRTYINDPASTGTMSLTGSGAISATGLGLDVSNSGTGTTTVNYTGAINTTGATGVSVVASTGAANVTLGNVTATGAGGSAVVVTSTGAQTIALNGATSGVVNGLLSTSTGARTITVGTGGNVTGGTQAILIAGTGTASVANSGIIGAAATPAGLAINAAGAGATTVTNNASGTINGRLTLSANADSFTNSGNWNTSGVTDFGAGADAFTNAAGGIMTLAGNTSLTNLETFNANAGRINLATFVLTGPAAAFTNAATGYIDTAGNAGLAGFTSMSNAGTLDLAAGIFTAPIGAFTNSGTILADEGAATITGQTSFANTGTIDLQDGAVGDVLTINSSFAGSGGSNLDVDFTATASDQLVINGAASGTTAVDAAYLGGGLNLDGALVVDTVSSSANAFVLGSVTGETPLLDVTLEQRGADYFLVAAPTAAAFNPLVVPGFAADLWYQSADEIFAETVKPATTTGISFWGEGYYSRDKYGDDDDSVVIDGVEFDVDNEMKTKRYGLQLGVDYGFDGGRIGLSGGYAWADANGNADADLKAKGWNVGIYGQFGGITGFHGEFLAKHDRYDAEFDDGAFDGEEFDIRSTGIDGSLGYRFGMGGDANMDVHAGISHVRTKVDDIDAFGFNYDIETLTSTRGRAGVRGTFGGSLAPYVDATVYHEFNDNRDVEFFDGVNTYDLDTNGKGTWVRLEAGLSGNDGPGPILAAWGDFGDRKGLGLRAGWRFGGGRVAEALPPPPPPVVAPPPPPPPATQTCPDGSVILATDACPPPPPPPPPPPEPERG